MLKQDLKDTFSSNSGRWDDQIAFSAKDVSIMLNVPLYTISKMCRNKELEAFKVGRHYRIKRYDVYKYIETQIEKCIII